MVLEALAYSGIQVNGGMEVSQERGTSGTGTVNTYPCDNWQITWNGTMALNTAIGASGTFPIPYHLFSIPSVAEGGLGATSYAAVQHTIEGYRIARLNWGTPNAQPLTIAFWTSHSRAGVYSLSIRNGAYDRSCVMSYTQAASNVPQYNVLTFPGPTGSGVWSINNTTGMSLWFVIACGTTYQAPATGTWYNSHYVAAAGQVNAVSTTSDVFRLTGVVVLPGIYAPTAAQSPLIMRSYDQELLTCKRYLQFCGQGMIAKAATATALDVAMHWNEMRNTPAVSVNLPTFAFYSSAGTFQSATGANITYEENQSKTGTAIRVAGFTGLTVGASGWINQENIFKLDARL
jgi:hypothetical protein